MGSFGGGNGVGNGGSSESHSQTNTNTDSNNFSDSHDYSFVDSSNHQVDNSKNTNAQNGDAVGGNKITYAVDGGIVNAAGKILETGMSTIGRALETGFQSQVAANDATGKTLQGSFISLTDTLKSIAGVASKSVETSASVANSAAQGLADVKGSTGMASLVKWLPLLGLAVIAFLFVRKK